MTPAQRAAYAATEHERAAIARIRTEREALRPYNDYPEVRAEREALLAELAPLVAENDRIRKLGARA